MRSALICVFFALLVRRGSWADSDFRPMPIPLNEYYDRRDSREIFTDNSPSVAAVPAHYWEDALRHSVYLTLVRDNIDQLIARGEVISPDTKPDQYMSKDIDDHDLWEKIKAAPFDRIKDDEGTTFGDVTVMSKGRLVEERGGFRFVEDETSKEKCGNDKCMEGVKAFWSVKRVRQREAEGKYNYELTFSISSQHLKKQKKPYENSVRTFTVKETTPDQALDMPQEHRAHEKLRVLPPGFPTRPTRAIWFHKNIVPTQSRHYQNGLDRIFSSFFSDDEDEYEPPRYRPHVHQPPPIYPQYSKVGHVGSPSDQQKRLSPYPYRPQVYKYARPLAPAPYPPPHHYGSIETDLVGHVHPDIRFGPPVKPIKTTRPAVLPTPLPPAASKNFTEPDSLKQTTQTVKHNTTSEAPPKSSEVLNPFQKNLHKIRPGPMKINYLPDHVRPPIYNAPPGVFVTMDKKPFKPMPPMKYLKPLKHRPVDFRPSPQVLDMQQFSEPDPLNDAFRPIMSWNSHDTNSSNITEKKTPESQEVSESSTQVNTHKTTPKGKKPPKKHENIKPTRASTTAPEIITASSDSGEESDAMQWANVVGAFSKTTPMASEKKSEVTESTPRTPTTTTTTSTTASTTAAAVKRRTTTTTEAPVETTTTRKPRTKRTRPPPKFAKPDKSKKHKRVTTTKAPEAKPTQDLTPQASSAASKASKPSTTSSTSTTTTTTTMTTTSRPSTTTTRVTTTTTTKQPSSTETKNSDTFSTTQPKIKNRFRQSTLMQKGTSVNHDKWSAPTNPDKSKTGPVKQPPRRKGSNFHGYVSSTNPTIDKDFERIHNDKGPSQMLAVQPLRTTTPYYEETGDQYETHSESSDYSNSNYDNFEDEPLGNDEQESRDHTEFLFQTSTTPSERTNEVDSEPVTTAQINTSPFSAPKNKTKCKKKKTQITTTTEEVNESVTEQTTTVSTSATNTSTPSIFEELFGSFTVDDSFSDYNASPSTPKSDLQEQGSEKHGEFVKLDDDLQDFLDSLERDGRDADVEDEYEEDDESEPSIDDEGEEVEDDSPSPRDNHNYEVEESVEDYKRPYSLFELMAMD